MSNIKLPNETIKLPDGTMTSLNWIKFDKLLVEYNPERFNLYASLFDDKNDIRSMKKSPMFEFIFEYMKSGRTGKKFNYINTRYYSMQILYGRTHSYAIIKISNFIKMFEDILKSGVKKPPLVIPEENEYFQIKDGHHRIACCMALGHVKTICKVITGQM